MIASFLKLCGISGLLTGVFLFNFSSGNFEKAKGLLNQDIEKVRLSLTNLKTLEDIELFEKSNSCNFSFVKNWDTQKIYKLETFLKEETGSEWNEKAIKATNLFKDKCKKNRKVVLFYSPQNKTFGLSPTQLKQ